MTTDHFVSFNDYLHCHCKFCHTALIGWLLIIASKCLSYSVTLSNSLVLIPCLYIQFMTSLKLIPFQFSNYNF